jgi:hypothetical protein
VAIPSESDRETYCQFILGTNGVVQLKKVRIVNITALRNLTSCSLFIGALENRKCVHIQVQVTSKSTHRKLSLLLHLIAHRRRSGSEMLPFLTSMCPYIANIIINDDQ